MIQPPLTPPTDNLYKFVALSGVALFIVGLAGPWTALSNVKGEAFKRETEFAVFKAESDALVRTTTELTKRAEDLAAEVDRLNAKPGDSLPTWLWLEPVPRTEDVQTRYRAITQERETIVRRRDELLTRAARLLAEVEGVRRSIDDAQVLVLAGAALALFGAGLAIWGFRRWYYRVQRYLDLQLAREFAAADTAAGNVSKGETSAGAGSQAQTDDTLTKSQDGGDIPTGSKPGPIGQN
jgi:hypothetical protein